MLSSLISLVVLAVSAAPAIALPQLTTRQTNLPSTFKWTSSNALVFPKNDGRGVAGVKDPSIIQVNGTYHVFASTAQNEGYSLFYFNFTDYSKANSSPFFYLDQSGIGTGYRAAPQVFYFAPQKLWYLVYQNGNAAYSTNKDISEPKGWTAPTNFYSGTPKIIEDNLEGGYWVDMWVICDDADCHLFSSDDNGRLYRSQTPLSNFPSGMSDPVIAMEEPRKEDLFEAANVYTIGEKSYLLLVECIGSVGRYFRSWTSTDIKGPWKALAATESQPFFGASNTVFNGTKWTDNLSHGEVVRTDVDQTLKIKPCGMEFLYQGVDPGADWSSYNALPWRLGLARQVGGC
ncbi:glycoside hydrolase family 62 protein [Sporormia fimetaria CBS 119925]|uniref:Alpha-L-arabinofuranosidase n=1 Tax=Sporormia fimetaria CBS 119925 TaxID=1340428 RepID=A0A6A6UVM3_9PLEO|nr:glycoside hydrolase family 62 protein [Sporormia fimetaria CBS 119925]